MEHYGFSNHETREVHFWMSPYKGVTPEGVESIAAHAWAEVDNMSDGIAKAVASIALSRVKWDEIARAAEVANSF